MPSRFDPLILAGMISLGVYALLLGVGGYVGYRKAGSRPSLYAGSFSATIALVSLALTSLGGIGFWVGLVLAVLMTGTFAARFRKTGRFMPSGMLALVSVAMIAMMGLAISRLG